MSGSGVGSDTIIIDNTASSPAIRVESRYWRMMNLTVLIRAIELACYVAEIYKGPRQEFQNFDHKVRDYIVDIILQN